MKAIGQITGGNLEGEDTLHFNAQFNSPATEEDPTRADGNISWSEPVKGCQLAVGSKVEIEITVRPLKE